jgi:RNA polymerase sigma-70 factor (ECF subfamily)
MLITPGSPRDSQVAALAARLRAGDTDALGEWYREEHPRVWRLALAFLADAHDADDLAQDAMLHLADRLRLWDPERPYEPWRTRVVLNLARDRRRRAAAHPTALLPDLPALLPAPDSLAEGREVRVLVQAALAHLPEREREAFVLHDLEGWDTAAVSEAMEIVPSSVRSLVTLARRRLRALLGPRLAPAAEDISHA